MRSGRSGSAFRQEAAASYERLYYKHEHEPPRGRRAAGENRSTHRVFRALIKFFNYALFIFFTTQTLFGGARDLIVSFGCVSHGRSKTRASQLFVAGKLTFVIVLITVVVGGASRKLAVCWGIPPELGLDSGGGGAGLDHPMIPNAEDKSLGLQLLTKKKKLC